MKQHPTVDHDSLTTPPPPVGGAKGPPREELSNPPEFHLGKLSVHTACLQLLFTALIHISSVCVNVH